MNYLLISFLLFMQSFSFPISEKAKTPVASHEKWDMLLKKHVKPNGLADYKGFLADSVQLHQYLQHLSTNPPSASAAAPEQLAYWINAYNAYTIILILRHYPVKSINEIGPKLRVPQGKSVWDVAFIPIAGKSYSLNDIEHQILRKKFNEPRIHFAVNCASISCPNLRAEAFTAAKLEQQLAEQARLFVNDLSKNKITKDQAQLSAIFQWFQEDFTKGQTLNQFLNQYAKAPLTPKAVISYLEYDWGLNDTQAK